MRDFNFKLGRVSEAGFTLIELAMVLIIAGFVFVPLVAVLVQQDISEEIEENIEQHKRALNALKFFLYQNGRLPCPADETRGPDDTDFGREDCAGTATPHDIHFGALPTHALNLPFHASVNAQGWKYFYAVTDNLVVAFDSDADPPQGAGTFYNAVGKITVESSDVAGASTAEAQFVIVDPGPDGKGSNSLYGSPNAIACAGTDDAENCNGDAEFHDFPFAIANGETDANYFDDSLVYSFDADTSDLWVIDVDVTGEMVIRPRSGLRTAVGNAATTDASLNVGGDVIIEPDIRDNGGDLDLRGATPNDSALTVRGRLEAENIEAQAEVRARNFGIGELQAVDDGAGGETLQFCRGEVYTDSRGDDACCQLNVYEDHFRAGGNEVCGNDTVLSAIDAAGTACETWQLGGASRDICCLPVGATQYALDEVHECCRIDRISNQDVCCDNPLDAEGNCCLPARLANDGLCCPVKLNVDGNCI